jgi:tRNA A37 threonylcarbamoyladenosine modification protein TsaB
LAALAAGVALGVRVELIGVCFLAALAAGVALGVRVEQATDHFPLNIKVR